MELVSSLVLAIVATIIVKHLIKKAIKSENTSCQVTNIPQLTNDKSLAFSYIGCGVKTPDVKTPEVKTKKGGFISKELLKSYLSSQIGKDKK